MSKKLSIVQVAPFEEQVPPSKYGGIELVMSNLTEELVKRGHKVTLLASGDSTTKAKLITIFEKSIRNDPSVGTDFKKRDAMKFMGMARVVNYLQQHKFDIIHNHIGWRFLPFSSMLNSTIVTTLHGPLDIEYQQFVYGSFSNANYISISKNQRQPMPKLNFVSTVYNGIQVDKFIFNNKKGKYAAFLGRMSPEKGPVQAIQAAKKAKIPLIMAAKVDLVDKKYFNKEVKPLIDGKLIKFIGEVDHRGKVKLLKDAAVLFALIQWEEPFGLFVVEALACGTPVIASGRGAIPELIKDGKTGFLVNNVNQAVKAFHNIDQINRQDCRKLVEDRFSVEKMADGYLKAYYKLLAKK